MSYTIPEYVDTQEQAILAVASAVKGEQVTGGDGSVNTALDILADALAGQDVEVPMTQQGAILALAQYVGGGGGVDVGPMTPAPQCYRGRILAGEDVDSDELLFFDEGIIYVSDTAIALNPTGAAAGTTARLTYDLSVTRISGIPIIGIAGFVVTFVDPDASTQTFATVRPWDGTITYTAEDDLLTLACVMPELESDEALWIHVITAD